MNRSQITTAFTWIGGILALILITSLVYGVVSGSFTRHAVAKSPPSSEISMSDDSTSSTDDSQSESQSGGVDSRQSGGLDEPQSRDNTGKDGVVTVDPDAEDCDCGPEFVLHKVTMYDTLSSLSTEYGVSVDRIAEFNDIWDVNLIFTGSTIRIPVAQQ